MNPSSHLSRYIEDFSLDLQERLSHLKEDLSLSGEEVRTLGTVFSFHWSICLHLLLLLYGRLYIGKTS